MHLPLMKTPVVLGHIFWNLRYYLNIIIPAYLTNLKSGQMYGSHRKGYMLSKVVVVRNQKIILFKGRKHEIFELWIFHELIALVSPHNLFAMIGGISWRY